MGFWALKGSLGLDGLLSQGLGPNNVSGKARGVLTVAEYKALDALSSSRSRNKSRNRNKDYRESQKRSENKGVRI